MTQALLNNLNQTSEIKSIANGNFTVANNVYEFEKIFNSKNECHSDTDNVTANKSLNETNDINQHSSDTLNNNKAYCDDVEDSFSSELKAAVIESVIDTSVLSTSEANQECTEPVNEEISDLSDDELDDISKDDLVNVSEMQEEVITPMVFAQVQTLIQTNSNSENTVSDNIEQKENNMLVKSEHTEFSTENIQEDSNIITDLQSETNEKESENKIDKEIAENLKIESIEVENETSADANSDSLMQNQTPQEQAVKAMLQGDIKVEKTFTDVLTNVPQNTNSNEIPPHKIIEQISKQMDKLNSTSKVNIVLNPESLGKINLQLINSKDGLQAQFLVTTQEAKNILMNGLEGLKDNLLSHGVNLDNVSIKLEESAESENQSDWTDKEGSRGGNKQQNSQQHKKNGEKPFEQMMFELNNNDKV